MPADHYDGQLEAIANRVTLALFILDERRHCTYMNPAAEQLTGFTLVEVQGRPLHDVVHHTRPDGTDYRLEECPIDRAFPENRRKQGEEVFIHKDGSFYPVAFTASPILQNGRPVGTIIEVRDIGEEKEARRQAALRGAIGAALTKGGSLDEVLCDCTETIVEHLEGECARIWIMSDDGESLELAASAGAAERCDDYGARISLDASPIGQIARAQKPRSDEGDALLNEDGAKARSGTGRGFAGYPLLVDGRTVGVLGLWARHALPARTLDALASVAGGIALSIDRHRAERERERAYRELEVERTRLATVFREAPAFIATLRGPRHVFEMANPAYGQLVGHRDLVGRTIREALPEIEGQGFCELLDRVYEQGELIFGTEALVQLQRQEGGELEERFVNFVYQPLADADGATTGILAHGVDVTDMVLARRRIEEQTRQLEVQAEELRRRTGELQKTQAELEKANEELAEANIRLIARAEEAEAANREAEEASAVATAFYEAAPIPAALVDRDLRFRRVNRTLATFYGKRPEEVVGRTLAEVAPGYAEQVEPYYRRVFKTREPVRDLELTIPSHTEPAEERHFLVNYFPVRVRTGEVIAVGVLAVDVTERRRVEEAQREQAMVVETVQRVGRSVASELELERIVQDVTDAATEVTGAQFGAFFYNAVNEEGESYTLYTISGAPRHAFAGFPMPRNTPVFGPTFHGIGIVRSADITQDPRYGQMAPYHGMPEGHLPVTSYLAVPVISRSGEVLGGLFFGHSEPGRFTEAHERLADGIAGWAAVAMDNASLFGAAHQARAEAERANEVKSEFLAIMSHELRTPLNAMIGYTELLVEGVPEPIPEGARHKVERIGVSARHLLDLIDEILSFSRLEAGEEKIHIERVDPAELIEEVEALMEPLALKKGIGFESRGPSNPRPIEGDPRKIRQILINLIGNAIKFAEEGRVDLVAEQMGDEMVFRVRDAGPGISEEHLERIFEAFWQADAGTTRTAGGTGLGLSVARRLARLMGGEITAESEVGKGTTFEVRLPT